MRTLRHTSHTSRATGPGPHTSSTDSACPGGVGPCDELVGRSYLAPVGDRTMVAGPTLTDDPLTTTDAGGAVTQPKPAHGPPAAGPCCGCETPSP